MRKINKTSIIASIFMLIIYAGSGYADSILLRVPSSFKYERGASFRERFAMLTRDNIEQNERGFLYLTKKNERICVMFVLNNGESKLLIKDNKFCYDSDDAMELRIMLLKSKMFSAKNNAGKQRRKAIDWWSDFFEKGTYKNHVKIYKTKRSRYPEVWLYLDSKIIKKADRILKGWLDVDRPDEIGSMYIEIDEQGKKLYVSYIFAREVFKNTEVESYILYYMILGEHDFVKNVDFLHLYSDESGKFDKAIELGGIVRLYGGDESPAFIINRPGLEHKNVLLGDGRTRINLIEYNGKIYAGVSDDKGYYLAIEDNLITPYLDGNMIAEIKRLSWFEESVQTGSRPQTGIKRREIVNWEPDFIEICREKQKDICKRNTGNYEMPPEVFIVSEKTGIKVIDIVSIVLDEMLTKEKRYDWYSSIIETIFRHVQPVFGNTNVPSYSDFESRGYNTLEKLRNLARDVQDTNTQGFLDVFEEIEPDTTKFFRNTNQFNFFKDVSIPDIIRLKGKGSAIRIWSLGCSYGCEPYGLAIMLLESRANWEGSNVEIIATDLNPRLLDKALIGIFDSNDMAHVPDWMREKYFIYDQGTGLYKISDEVKKLVRFIKGDILDKEHRKKMTNFDVVFARNIVSKFTVGVQKDIYNYLVWEAVSENGFIFMDIHDIGITGELEGYRVYDDLGTAFRSLCIDGSVRYTYSPVYQKKGLNVSRHAHYPGDEAYILPENKLADVLSFAGISEDKKLTNPIFMRFRKDIAGWPREAIDQITFELLYKYAQPGAKVKLALDANGKVELRKVTEIQNLKGEMPAVKISVSSSI